MRWKFCCFAGQRRYDQMISLRKLPCPNTPSSMTLM